MLVGIEPYLEPNETWAKSANVKNMINTLQLECSKSMHGLPISSHHTDGFYVAGQQVADLLRDRLQTVGAELIDAKSRTVELETAQGEDRAALCRANATLASTGKLSVHSYRVLSSRHSQHPCSAGSYLPVGMSEATADGAV